MGKEGQVSLITSLLPGVKASWNRQKLKMSSYSVLDVCPLFFQRPQHFPLLDMSLWMPPNSSVACRGRKGLGGGGAEYSGVLFSFSKNHPQNHLRWNWETRVLTQVLISGKPWALVLLFVK